MISSPLIKAFVFSTALWVGAFAVGKPACIRIHKFEDGFVERTVAVIVRDDKAIMKYSVGLNETTIRQVMDDWEKKSVPTSPKAAKVEPSDDLPPRPKTPPLDRSPITPNPAHVISPEVLAEFRERIVTELPKKLNVRCDNSRLEFESAVLGETPRHPFTVMVKLEFRIPASKSCDIAIEDNNFRSQTGAVRYSLKALGNSMLHSSNVAPIIVRAERAELEELSPTEIENATTISAKMSVVATNTDDK